MTGNTSAPYGTDGKRNASGCDADYYKNAVTGDYDLFAVWPKKGSDHAKTSSISRVSERGQKRFAVLQNDIWIDIIPSYNELEQTTSGMDEDPRLGNVTDNVMLAAQMLNSLSLYVSGQVVDPNKAFHSDEGGRPGIDTLDLPTAVFVPCEGSSSGSGTLAKHTLARYQREMMKTKLDFLAVVKELKKNYVIQIQLGWLYDLLVEARKNDVVYAQVKEIFALDARKMGAGDAFHDLKACVNGGRAVPQQAVVSSAKVALEALKQELSQEASPKPSQKPLPFGA